MHQWNHHQKQACTSIVCLSLSLSLAPRHAHAVHVLASILNNIAMINGFRNWGTCSMWHKLLSLCVISFLFLTAERVPSSPHSATAYWLAGVGGCDGGWQHSNNPCKWKGRGVNANVKSTMEKWLKSISVSFISWYCWCHRTKDFKRSRLRSWNLMPALI